ncbi:MAG: cell envelope integrity protein TolA [Candidatus Nitrotoga sp.]
MTAAKLQTLCAVITFLLFTLSVPAIALTPSEVFEYVKDSVFVVKTFNAQGEQKGMGSGVLLPTGKIATNCHVVEDGGRFEVGRNTQFAAATLYASDHDKDICLLDTKGAGGKAAQLGSAASLKVGVPVYAVGAPQGLELSLSDGIVSQLRGSKPPLIQTTAAISPGSSGGGLFDSNGRLVGLTTLYIKGGQNLNFAIPVEWLAEVKIDWLEQAFALAESEDWFGVLDWGLQWVKAEPEEAFAWHVLGDAYTKLNRHTDAVDAYRQAVRIDPEEAVTWYNLGNAYGILERPTDAVDAYRQAVRINPEDADAWLALSIVYAELNRHTDAIDAYRQAVRIDPEKSNAAMKALKLQEAAQEAAKARKLQETEQAEQARAQPEELTAGNSIVNDYKARILAKIKRKIKWPEEGHITAVYEVTLLPDGSVLESKLVKSSGNPAYDRQTESAIELAQPLPLPPDQALFSQFRKIQLKFSPTE